MPDGEKMELIRAFRFRRFQAAVDYMYMVAPGCDIAQHHPRWENVWKTLTVHLSTWDGGLHKITERDLKLARYLDRAYIDFGEVSDSGS